MGVKRGTSSGSGELPVSMPAPRSGGGGVRGGKGGVKRGGAAGVHRWLPSAPVLLSVCAALLIVTTFGLQFLASDNSSISDKVVRRGRGVGMGCLLLR
jgi:hypothetical protein